MFTESLPKNNDTLIVTFANNYYFINTKFTARILQNKQIKKELVT